MNTPRIFDLIIVGGGMTGLALAAGLADTELNIAVVEAAEQPPVWQADCLNVRVSALSEASHQLLAQVGAWPAMQAMRVTPYQGMTVWDGEGTAQLHFRALEAGVEQLGYMAENVTIQLGLEQAVAKQKNLTWFRGRRPLSLTAAQNASGQRLLQLDDHTQLQANLVVAADGAHSSLRQWAGFKTLEWDYQHHALVTSVRMEKSHNFTAWQCFHSEGPIALLPFEFNGDDHWCSLVWSTNPKEAEALLALDEPRFNERLTERFEGRLGRVELSQKRQTHPLRQRHALRYVQPGLALMGDAAHTIHPLAGQGVNLGFQDTRALTQVIRQAAELGQPLGHQDVLAQYQRQRQLQNLRMTSLMEGLKQLFSRQELPLLLARNLGMKLVNQNAWIKRQLIAQALGIG